MDRTSVIFCAGLLLMLVPSMLFMGLIIQRRSWRFIREKDRTPLYIVACGGKFGWWRYSSPFIQLRMYDDFLVISAIHQIQLHYDDIDEIDEIGGALMRYRTLIKHHDYNAPNPIHLSANPTKIITIFEQYTQSAL